MQWKITTPPAIYPVTVAAAALNASIDDLTTWTPWLTDAIAACTDYAEAETQLSFITRTITAQYWPEKSGVLPTALPLPPYSVWPLFRGPLQAVASVQDAAGNAAPYILRRVGTQDFIQLEQSTTAPLTVVYTAGYGDAAANVPADIRGGILAHVAHRFRYREADAESTPVGLQYIYDKYRAGGYAG